MSDPSLPRDPPPPDLRKACCRDEANLAEPVPSGAPGEVMRVCRVCGCRHFAATIDKMGVGVRGA